MGGVAKHRSRYRLEIWGERATSQRPNGRYLIDAPHFSKKTAAIGYGHRIMKEGLLAAENGNVRGRIGIFDQGSALTLELYDTLKTREMEVGDE